MRVFTLIHQTRDSVDTYNYATLELAMAGRNEIVQSAWDYLAHGPYTDYTPNEAFDLHCEQYDGEWIGIDSGIIEGLTHTMLREAFDECVKDLLEGADKVGGPA